MTTVLIERRVFLVLTHAHTHVPFWCWQLLSEKHVFGAQPPCSPIVVSFSVFSLLPSLFLQGLDVTYSTQQHAVFHLSLYQPAGLLFTEISMQILDSTRWVNTSSTRQSTRRGYLPRFSPSLPHYSASVCPVVGQPGNTKHHWRRRVGSACGQHLS